MGEVMQDLSGIIDPGSCYTGIAQTEEENKTKPRLNIYPFDIKEYYVDAVLHAFLSLHHNIHKEKDILSVHFWVMKYNFPIPQFQALFLIKVLFLLVSSLLNTSYSVYLYKRIV